MEPFPCEIVQVTAVFVEPETVAANCCCHFSGIATVAGEILTETLCAAATVMLAAALFVGSAALVEVTT